MTEEASFEDELVKFDIMVQAHITQGMQTLIQKIGPMPEKLGEFFREIISGKEINMLEVAEVFELMAQCEIEKSYEPYLKGRP